MAERPIFAGHGRTLVLLLIVMVSSSCKLAPAPQYEIVPEAQSSLPILIATAVQDTTWHLVWSSIERGINYQRGEQGGVLWTSPVQLSTEPATDLSLIVTDSALHLFWVDGDVHYVHSLNAGLSWETAQNRLGEGIFFADRVVARALAQDIHVLLSSRSEGVFYQHSTDNGMSWDPIIRLTPSSVYSISRPDMNVTLEGVVHVVWTDYVVSTEPGYPKGLLFYHKSADGGGAWDAEPRQLEQGGSIISYATIATVGNHILIAWAREGNLFWQRSDDGGVSWTTPRILKRGWVTQSEQQTAQLVPCSEQAICLLWIDERHQQRDWWYRIPILGDLWWGLNPALDPFGVNNDLYMCNFSLPQEKWGEEQRLTVNCPYVHSINAIASDGQFYVFWSGKENVGKSLDDTLYPYRVLWRRFDLVG
jgi:hypothetical protein